VTTFLLGVASPLLIAAGWAWNFLLFDLGLVAALAAVFYGVRALRRARAKALAAAGLLLALLSLAVIVYFFITFALNPPE
jgi:hypothetical protein